MSAERSAARSAQLAFLALMLANVCLAFGPLLVRLADVGPVSSAFWRLAIGAPLLLVLIGGVRQPMPRATGAMLGILVFGGLCFAADMASWHTGILHTKLANSTLFGNCTSFILPIYGFLVARALPGRNQAIALALAGLGVMLLLGRSYQLSADHLLGDLLSLLAGVFYTGYLVAMGKARATMGPLQALSIATFAGAPPLLLLALAMGQPIMPQDWTPLILLALGSQVIGQGLMVYAVGHLSSVVLGLGLLVQPVIAALIGWARYGEGFGLPDAIGAIAIAVALVLVRRPDRPSKSQKND